jgi:hypothetical protein
VVFGKFERRADVDDFVEIGQAIEGNKQVFQGAARKSARVGSPGLSHAGKSAGVHPRRRRGRAMGTDTATRSTQINVTAILAPYSFAAYFEVDA